MNNIQTIILLALNEIKNYGPKTIIELYSNFRYLNDNLFDFPDFIEFLKSKNLNEEFIEIFNQKVVYIQNELSKDKVKSIKIISFFDDEYPIQLTLLKNPPLFLFCRGNTILLKNMNNIAIVGTRGNSELGAKIAAKTAYSFVDYKYTIVSGLARGIDTAAHIGTLRNNGNTIAILTDLNKIYPSENISLANEILHKNGLLLSEIAPWKNIYRNAFVDRDRLQSGMSLGTFVIETDIIGGTMHTVKFTLDQNRHLFVPDISKLEYEDGFSKINGIKHLIHEGKAIIYDKSTYPQVLDMLEEKKNEIIKEHIIKVENTRKLL